jgi:predicted transcriptional regulator
VTIQVVALISIRPHHASRLWSGAKRAEFRRARVRMVPPLWLAVYETLPVGAVTGAILVQSVTHDTPAALIALEPDLAERATVCAYLRGSKRASALHVHGTYRLDSPLPLDSLGVLRAPQSYQRLPAPVTLLQAEPGLAASSRGGVWRGGFPRAMAQVPGAAASSSVAVGAERR